MNEKHQEEAASKKGIAFRLGNHYLDKNISKLEPNRSLHYLLSSEQKHAIRQIRLRTYTYSALIGAIAVLVVILPYHLFDFFQPQHIEMFDYTFDFELYYSIYGVVMIFPEIWLLKIVNIKSVKKMCEVYQYPTKGHRDYEEQIALLTEAGLEIPNKYMETLEVDPYIGLSKFYYYLLFALTKLKAALSNVLLKLLVRRVLGRYALRIFMDLVGIPVYAFWDAWASHKVMKEAQLRITSSTASKNFIQRFTEEEIQRIETIYPLLVNYIAQQKRAYNFSLYAYIKELSVHFPKKSLKIDRVIHLEELFGDEVEKNTIVAELLVFGFIIDGTISVKERHDLHKLTKEEWFPMTIEQVEERLKEYVGGEEIR